MDGVTYTFTVRGGFDVDPSLEPMLDASGVICGFRSKGGVEYSLAVCLLAEGRGGETVRSSEVAMARSGFRSLDYSEASFYPA